ncbi:PAS domain S-box protein [Ancylomarina sp. YFZ004]
MKDISKYYYLTFGFLVGFLLSLVAVIAEDYQHQIPIREALSSFLHYTVPILIGIISSIIAYLLWKIKNQEITNKNNLLENQDRNNTMISNISDVIAIKNAKGIMTYNSPNIEHFFGWSPEELIGDYYLNIIHPDDQNLARNTFNNLLKDEGKNQTLRLRLKCKDCSYKPIQITAINLMNNPDINGILCNYKDITEQLKNEQALIYNEHKYRGLFENMIDIVTMLDKDKRIIDINPAATELFEYSREELLNMTIDQLVFQGDKESSNEHFQELEDTGSYSMYEGRVITKTGKIKWLQVNSSEFVKDGIVIGSQDICRDITQQKEIEIKLDRAFKELKKMNTDKDRLLSILAHDLKSPFNSILGFLNLLSNNIREYNINEIEEYVNIINDASQNTYHLLENILIWVKANSGEISYKPQKLNFTDTCKEVIDNLKLSADIKNIKINAPSMDGNILFADQNLLVAVLRNLVSNSIKFTEENGQIDICSERNHKNLTITVSDNGVGMTTEAIKKVFDISQTYTTKGTADESGTGFGLLLCQEFVEINGGEIWIESELGKGCEIKFTTPLFVD